MKGKTFPPSKFLSYFSLVSLLSLFLLFTFCWNLPHYFLLLIEHDICSIVKAVSFLFLGFSALHCCFFMILGFFSVTRYHFPCRLATCPQAISQMVFMFCGVYQLGVTYCSLLLRLLKQLYNINSELLYNLIQCSCC